MCVRVCFVVSQQVPHWGPELIEKEHHAKQTAEVLFFVTDRRTRSVAATIEAAYYTAAQKKFVLVIDRYEGPGQVIQGEPISEQYEQENRSTPHPPTPSVYLGVSNAVVAGSLTIWKRANWSCRTCWNGWAFPSSPPSVRRSSAPPR